MADWRARLSALCAEYGVADCDGLVRLLELVRDDPTAPTTVRDPPAAVDAHVADSLAALALPALQEAAAIADLGTGAGFPGLPLALARPQARVFLVESLGRKCAFLERAVDASGAANATVVCRRAEEWPERGLDVVCVRAVAPLAVLVEYAAPLLRVGGSLVAWKGRPETSEVAGGRAAAEIVGLEEAEVVTLTPRAGAERRTLYLYSKVLQTPDRFPRRAGMARKRPLAP